MNTVYIAIGAIGFSRCVTVDRDALVLIVGAIVPVIMVFGLRILGVG